MSYTVIKYPQGTFSWCDVASKDIAVTKEFMTKLLGWTFQDMPTGDGRPDYTMFFHDGYPVAGGMPAFDPHMPSFWGSYITVGDVDAMVVKAENLGAKIVMPAMDVMDSGRMATIQDPTGAMVNLWQPNKHIGAGIVNTVGAMCWNELYTKDLQASQKFYTNLLGWTYEDMPGAEGTYAVIKNNGRSNGGMMLIDESWGNVPAHWLVYFTVADLEQSVAKVKELDGQVHMQKDISVGKIAMTMDPTGAAFMLFQMNGKPEEWVE